MHEDRSFPERCNECDPDLLACSSCGAVFIDCGRCGSVAPESEWKQDVSMCEACWADTLQMHGSM
jgi:hypothetical protein